MIVAAYALMAAAAAAIGWCLETPGDQLAVMLPACIVFGAGILLRRKSLDDSTRGRDL